MASKRILIADENDRDFQIASNVLHRLGLFDIQRARSALEAIQATRDGTFDVVLMDTHFSDGSSGIGAIKVMFLRRGVRPPQIVMMSSQPDEETVRRSMAAGAVDYLAKPLDPHWLLERLQNLLGRVHREKKEKIEQQIRKALDTLIDLPTLPEVVVSIEQLSEGPHASAKDLSHVIELDQAITAKVLRVANSAFYSFVRTIRSVQEAVVLLGLNTIKGLVMALSTFKVLAKVSGSGRFDRRRLWEHSAACGVIASRIDHQLRMENSASFTAGVLHDVGKVVLDSFFPEYFASVLERMKQDHLLMVEAEQEVLGLTHADVGVYLGERWRFPSDLVEAIGDHHRIMTSEGPAHLSALIHVSDVMCYRLKEERAPEMDPSALDLLGLDEKSLAAWTSGLREEIERATRMLME